MEMENFVTEENAVQTVMSVAGHSVFGTLEDNVVLASVAVSDELAGQELDKRHL